MASAFGQALLDHHRGERTAPLVQRDGEHTLDHPVERFYFGEFDGTGDPGGWFSEHLSGPLVDLGAGAGRHALYFQERFETVAIEPDPTLVELLDERGVDDAREADMFALREAFERDRFRSVLAEGTQLGLAGSMDGLRAFLADLAHVTTPDATAVVDCYDPTDPNCEELLGYRADRAPGLASRVMSFEYEDRTDDVLLFRLFSPERLREAAVGTDWSVAEVRTKEDTAHYFARLAKCRGR
jgi:hypothetical protein